MTSLSIKMPKKFL